MDSLEIIENRFLLSATMCEESGIDRAIAKFKNHPSVLNIKEHIEINEIFSFQVIDVNTITSEINRLKSKKSGTFMNIPAKQLKCTVDIISEPLMNIWNNEIIRNGYFPKTLKLADITPIFKKLENISVKNYRAVSVLPSISKLFEKIMQKQICTFVEKYLSPYLCGYRKGYNGQYALLTMIENWKKSLDNHGLAGGVLMDLSKAFDTINHELLIAKLYAYGFDKNALRLIFDYLTDRWQRTKINGSFSSWAELLCGVPQGSVLGPLFFNIYINDLFYVFINTSVCNIADDTTPYACDNNLETLLANLEYDSISAIMWFEANYMKLNQEKCHFLISGNLPEQIWIKVGEEVIWESKQEKLLGVIIDKKLNFDIHLTEICKKASAKVTALARMVKIIPFEKKRILMKAFIESQFSYCSLLWMFCSRKMNRRINYIHERALRLVYEDNSSSFEELLIKDNSVCNHHRNLQRVAIEMFKIKHNLCPQIVQEMFSIMGNSKFHRPNVNSVYNGEQSLRYFGPIVWNQMIPEEIKIVLDLEDFKNKISTWRPSGCQCRLCRSYIAGVGFVNSN